MANEQNLKKFNSETAKANQPKSVESRYKNKIRNGLIASAIMESLSDDDLREIARGIIDRAKESSDDLVKLRDTIGEKPVDRQEVAVADISHKLEDVFSQMGGDGLTE